MKIKRKQKKSFDLASMRVLWAEKEWVEERDLKEFLERETELIRLLYYREINFQQFMDRRKMLIGGNQR